jgi:predicted nucleic acid-binding protein
VRDAMGRAEAWFICRVGYVETIRAAAFVGGRRTADAVEQEWPAFSVVEVDQRLVEDAAELAVKYELRTTDALHLAAATLLAADDLVFATWDPRLHAAAREGGFELLPLKL